MANSTFLKLTNELLEEFNEVPLTENNFGSARGIHSAAKNAIKRSVNTIIQKELEWPFNAVEHRRTLVVGQTEYVWPTGFITADWESFKLASEDNLNAYKLQLITRDEWYSKLREKDVDAGATGIERPRYVFQSHGTGYGVSPSPDKMYEISFRYYIMPEPLENALDQTRIPNVWDHVIIEGGSIGMHRFHSDHEMVNAAERSFRDKISYMRTILINKEFKIYDRRVDHSPWR